MTPEPRDEVEVRSELEATPLDNTEAARHLEHLLGMTPEAAATYASFVSGRYAAFRRRPL
jgi:hypothetical protein